MPAMQESQVQFLSWEDPLEKEMATRSSVLAWRIPWTEEPGRLQSMGLQKVGQDLATKSPPELTIERSYQTHSHNLCLKIRLVRKPS